MAKISGSIPNFANGISQQAMALRLSTQGDYQLNGYSTIVDGLKKRPPTQRRASVTGTVPAQVYSHMINRDLTERYSVLISAGGIRVFDLDGDEKTVNAPGGYGYLSYPAGHQRPPYRAITVGDYTFITNQTRTVQEDEADVAPTRPHEAIVHVLAGNYGKTYKIKLDGDVVAQYRTPDGSSAAQSPAVDTSFIAERLATGATVDMETTVNGHANGGWGWRAEDKSLADSGITPENGWTVKVFQNTIYIRRTGSTDFSIGVDDGYNGHAMKTAKGSIQDFADLPVFCEDGMVVEITGSVATEYDNYWVQFERQDETSSEGIWREVPAPGSVLSMKAHTLPHILVREANGTFTFKTAEWDKRKAGSQTTTPGPSIAGSRVYDMLFFKNRLGFLAGENVLMSRAGDYFDLWRATATALLDDDPIDVAAADNMVSVLRSAVPMSDRLILFADQLQFTLMGNELLTPKTASIRVSTSFASSQTVRPERAGNSIFFPVNRGQFSMIREYRIDPGTGIADAEDVTGHVPQYIQGRITNMAASTHEDVLVVQNDNQPDTLYVYKHYWADEQRLQASWSHWTFPGVTRILDFGFIDSELVVTVQRPDGYFIETIEVQPGGTDPHMNFVVNLDRRFRVAGDGQRHYDPFSDTTSITMPHDITVDDRFICVSAGSPTNRIEPGIQLEITHRAAGSVILRGDMRSVPLYFGIPYEFRYRMSTIFIREEKPRGGVSAVTEGRLQITHLLVQYSRSAFLRVEVTPMGRETRSYVSNGRLMGDPRNRVDKVILNDGTFRVPVLSKNDWVEIEFVNDSYLPVSVIAAEWIGNFHHKTRRI